MVSAVTVMHVQLFVSMLRECESNGNAGVGDGEAWSCFLLCICLWQMSQIQTCLFVVVGTGIVQHHPLVLGVRMAGLQKR